MIRLLLLGGVRLTDAEGRDIRAVLQQPKRLAVLAYLATARPRNAQRRDSLVALFWPELSEERARASLSQALYFLRNNTNPNLVAELGRERVGLSHGAVWCDVVEFEGLLEAGQVEEALRLYDGDFMRGLHISDAPEWEKWLDEERERLRKLAVSAAWELATREETAGHAGLAVHWASWAAGMNPLDESGHRRLLELLDRTGDRGRALRTHEEWARRFEHELEVEPAEETLRLVEAIRGKTYRGGERPAPAALPERASRSEWVPAQPTARDWFVRPGASGAAPPSSPRRRRRLGAGLAAAAAVFVLTFGAFWATSNGNPPAAGTADRPPNRLAILPFDDASEGGQLRYFADGLAATLITHLTQVEELHVVSHSGVRQFRDGGASIDSIARALNVGSVVGGSVTESNGVYRVIVNLVDTHTGETLASERIERPRAELLALLDDLSSTVAWMLRQELRQQIRLTELRAGTEEPRAWEFVQRASEALDEAIERHDAGDLAGAEAAFAHALDLTSEAIAVDDEFVGAYVRRSEIFERSAWAAFVADPAVFAQRLDSAQAAVAQALEIAPQHAAALEQRGNLRLQRWVDARPSGQTSENLLIAAEQDLRAALRVQPNRARAEARLSQVLYQRGDFHEAYYAARRAYSSDAYVTRPDDILWRMFETAFEIGEDDEAGTWCDELRRRNAASWLYGKCTLMLLAWGGGEASDIRKALHAFEGAMSGTPPPMRPMAKGLLTMMLAANYASVGDRTNAEASIAAAKATGFSDIVLMAEEAAVRTMLGDFDRAQELIDAYIDAAPAHRRRITRSRWYEPLRTSGALVASDN